MVGVGPIQGSELDLSSAAGQNALWIDEAPSPFSVFDPFALGSVVFFKGLSDLECGLIIYGGPGASVIAVLPGIGDESNA